jgi:GntR family transcriptional regulator/MocR family aminotransferase
MTGPSDLHIRLSARGGLARQIYRQIRAAIHSGRLNRGDRLPPTRELAQRLDVSRNTVSLAYEWLAAEGLLSGHRSGGTIVESDPVARNAAREKRSSIRSRGVWDDIVVPRNRDFHPRFDFGVGMPDVMRFPFDVWRRLLARQVRASRMRGDYGDPAGHPRLRAAIARSIAISRGVVASAEDVIVTNGAQGAFDLIARVLLEPGMRAAVEEPGYPPPRMLFESYGARIAAVRVDDSGLDVAALPPDARLIYVTPSHQFPLGMPMSHTRRIALLDWAERRNAVIIEDDYDSEFRFGGRPLDTLQAMDRSGRVIYVGSFSKSLLPSLRLGFLIAPPALRDALEAAAYVASWYPQWPAQAALASMIDEGLLARHVRKMRREYAARHERILRKLDWLTPIASVTGMHIAARVRSLRVEAEVAQSALANSVGFDRLSTYCSGTPRQPGIVLGYGGISTAKIDEGIDRLRRCFENPRYDDLG